MRKVRIVYRLPEFLCCRVNWDHPPPPPQASVGELYVHKDRDGGNGTKIKAESIRDTSIMKKSSCYRKISSKPQPNMCGKVGKILQIIQQFPNGTKMTQRTLVVTTLKLFTGSNNYSTGCKIKQKFLCFYKVKWMVSDIFLASGENYRYRGLFYKHKRECLDTLSSVLV
jgi:hypothetical protein